MVKHEPVEELDKKSTLKLNNNKIEPVEIKKDKITKKEKFDIDNKVQIKQSLNNLGTKPVELLSCPYCSENVITDVDYKSGGATWIWCCAISTLGILNPLVWLSFSCFIPFCCTKCKDAIHYCPKCDHQLGTFKLV